MIPGGLDRAGVLPGVSRPGSFPHCHVMHGPLLDNTPPSTRVPHRRVPFPAGGVELLQQLAHGDHGLGVKLVRSGGVDGQAHAARLGVHAERRLEQVVHLLGHLQVQSGVGMRQHHLAQAALQRASAARVTRLDQGLYEGGLSGRLSPEWWGVTGRLTPGHEHAQYRRCLAPGDAWTEKAPRGECWCSPGCREGTSHAVWGTSPVPSGGGVPPINSPLIHDRPGPFAEGHAPLVRWPPPPRGRASAPGPCPAPPAWPRPSEL